MEFKKYKLHEIADIDFSGVDKKSIPGESSVKLCNFVDVYYNWAITKHLLPNFMIATAKDNQIERLSLKKGQVALTKDSETRDDIGISTYIADDFEETVVLGYHNALVTPHEDILDGKYLNAYLHTKMAKDYFSNNASGSGQRYALSVDAVNDIQIFVPSLEEQHKIGKLLSDLDRKIELNKQINANLEAMAKQLYDYWFVQFDFPNEEGMPYKSSGGKMIWNETLKREIPEGWEESSILKKDIYNTDYTANGSFAGLAENVKYNYGDKYAIVIRIIDYNNNFSDYSKFVYINKDAYEYLSKSTLYGDEIIICNVGNVGITFRCPKLDYPMTLGPNGIMVNSNKYNNFLYMYFISEIGQQQLLSISAGSIQKKFNKTDFRNMSLVFPPDNILDCFNKLYQPIYDGIKSNNKKISILKNLRDSLLPLLMNGQVRIKEE